MYGYWEIVAFALFVVAFSLYVVSLWRIMYQRTAEDVYEIIGAMIISELAVFGIVEWVWMSWVFYLLGQTFWCPDVMVYYFGVFTVMLLIMVVTGLALVYYVAYEEFEVKNRGEFVLKGFLLITSSALLGWIMEDRIAGALTVWTVPHSWYLYWSSWTWLWAPYLAFMIPYWLFSVWYIWIRGLNLGRLVDGFHA